MQPDPVFNARGLPAFCPNPNCRYHHGFYEIWPIKKQGFYFRQAKPQRIQRYQCRHCGRCFSSQTFSTTYWLREPQRLQRLFMRSVGCMANRQIARDLRCAPSTVDRLLARLGRHFLLFHWQIWNQQALAEPCVIDGFESFEFSQYHPFHFNLCIGANSGFIPYFTDSELRRKGRMRPAQKRKREQLEARQGRPDPKAITKGVKELLDVVLARAEQVELRSDEHHAYRPAIAQQQCVIDHRVTPSKARRDADNPLWAINHLDMMLRHSGANHKRETIAWSKRRQAAAERLALCQVWWNYVRKRYEKGARETPAMLAGLCDRMLSVEEVLACRRFRTRVSLPPRWSEYYDRAVPTRALPKLTRHRLSYAY
jgi:transposase-like protein